MKKGEVEKQLKSVEKSSDVGKKLGASWGSQFAMELKHKLDYAWIGAGSKVIKNMVANVKELNVAQTELKKVSDLSGKSLQDYTDKAYKLGEVTGKTGTEMIEAATEFKKRGFGEEESLELASIATKFQNIADVEISAGTAASFINSQLKAFNYTANKSEYIIDAVNEV